MPGVTAAVLVPLLLVAGVAIAAAGALIDDRGLAAVVLRRPGENRPQPGRSATLAVELPQTWTLAHAGLVPAAAWLTAPRETPEFAARAAAIAAAYDRADRKAAAALRRAGMTKRKGWTCA